MGEAKYVQSVLATLEDVGLGRVQLLNAQYQAQEFGNAIVTCVVDGLFVRIIRERMREFIEIGPAADGPWHTLSDIQVAMGWRTVEELFADRTAEPLAHQIELIRIHWTEMLEAFSHPRLEQTTARIASAVNERKRLALRVLRGRK